MGLFREGDNDLLMIHTDGIIVKGSPVLLLFPLLLPGVEGNPIEPLVDDLADMLTNWEVMELLGLEERLPFILSERDDGGVGVGGVIGVDLELVPWVDGGLRVAGGNRLVGASSSSLLLDGGRFILLDGV